MDATVADLVDPLACHVGGVLGADLVGVYLTGSAVTDRFRPDTSDIDVFVVTRSPLSDAVCADLDRVHAEMLRTHP